MALAWTIDSTRYTFADLKDLLAKASPARSGDALAGVVAQSATERVAAKMTLADLPLQRFLTEALIPYGAAEAPSLPTEADIRAENRTLEGGLVRPIGKLKDGAVPPTPAKVLGAKTILAQDPQTRPDSVACFLAPLVHAATQAARKMFYAIYAEFASVFRAAAEALRQGCRDVPFPADSFPSTLPFMPS